MCYREKSCSASEKIKLAVGEEHLREEEERSCKGWHSAKYGKMRLIEERQF